MGYIKSNVIIFEFIIFDHSLEYRCSTLSEAHKMRMIKSGVLDEKKYYCDGRKKWEKRGKKSEEDENDERMEKSEIGKEESEE